jgi:hypothetical protein
MRDLSGQHPVAHHEGIDVPLRPSPDAAADVVPAHAPRVGETIGGKPPVAGLAADLDDGCDKGAN